MEACMKMKEIGSRRIRHGVLYNPGWIHKKVFHLCTSLVCTGKSECYAGIYRTKGIKLISLFTCAENWHSCGHKVTYSPGYVNIYHSNLCRQYLLMCLHLETKWITTDEINGEISRVYLSSSELQYMLFSRRVVLLWYSAIFLYRNR